MRIGFSRRHALRLAAAAALTLALPCRRGLAQEAETVRVRRLLPGFAAELLDGRRIRLASLQPPQTLGAPKELQTRSDEAFATSMQGSLRIFGGKEAEIDRHGQAAVQVQTADGAWVQQALLQDGLAAYFSAVPLTAETVSQLLSAEGRARQQGAGIWRLPDLQPLSASAVTARTRGFRLVEGRVASLVERRGGLVFEFETAQEDGRGFSVRVAAEDAADFSRGGFKAASYVGQQVRVRGWLYNAGGPALSISISQQLELLGD